MWDSFRPENAVWYRWRLNGAAAFLRRDRDSWLVAFRTIPFRERDGDFGGPEPGEPPWDLPAVRAWGSGEDVLLHPYLSALPYIVRLRERIRVAPGSECRLTLALPPALKFELGTGEVLAEEMPFVMSGTFLGPDSMTGSICHSLPDVSVREADGRAEPSAFIHCDVLVRNGAKTVLDAGTIAVHPEPLSVYVHDGRLVTDPLELDLAQADCEARACPVTGRPDGRGRRLITSGTRQRVGENLARRGVGFIRDITGI